MEEKNIHMQPNINYTYRNPNMYNMNYNNPIVPPPQQQMQLFVNDWKSILSPIQNCKIKQQFDDREFVVLSYGKEISKPDILMEKDCTCTFLCFNRPTIRMYDFSNNNNKELIGTIKAPYKCCSYNFNLFDSSNNKIMYMDDTCCQMSILFPCPWGPFKYSNFFLRDANSKEKIAHLRKEVPFLKFVKRDIDNYTLDFEQVQNPEWKMMLLAFALFLDYMYYDRK
ncbi:putative phospholipid scramblase [Plasmodium gaboni]|uniref:Phospholipid scramblase n=1 Tax=Plasmodium gaboni TaxID=647221 RepID=A0A151LL72_9APIC|nr:putative phospholipid scramblase [Plasmodium gaboni]KYN99609.1 putative phospholipid scramblase [Plasmodium gaboni]